MRLFGTMRRSFRRAFKEHAVTDAAAAVTYYTFLAIPSLLLVAVGFFGIFAGPQTIATVVDRLSDVVPAEAVSLIEESLTRVVENRGGSAVVVAIGFAAAAWTATGAMGAVMRALNRVYGRDESRGFVAQRATGLAMVAFLLVAFSLVFGLLVLGPHLSGWIGNALDLERLVRWAWWVGQWPILLAGLLLAFAGIYWLGPDRTPRRFRSLTAGAVLAVVIWLAASGLFAVYASTFASYGEAWGPLAAVVVMLTWIWLSSLALLLGAELNVELERERAAEHPLE